MACYNATATRIGELVTSATRMGQMIASASLVCDYGQVVYICDCDGLQLMTIDGFYIVSLG